ncbi:MAG TPA: cyanophycin synthetase, partial [Candidatus Udaeobacter sp.]|nr:cyanophycin synthetase [Candidatus Udaeobacter sp.]
VRATEIELAAERSRFVVDGVPVELPLAGIHNVDNALAALAAGRAIGVPVAELAPGLARFRGVARRLQRIGVARGVTVIDDFAHNPAKLQAAIAAVKLGRPRRVLAVYQPHGFGPTRFLRRELVAAFASALAPADRLWLLEIFYAGGNATRDLSSADLEAELAAGGTAAEFAPSREQLVARLVTEAGPGDVILIMGARDPSLPELCRTLLEALAS